MPAPTEPTTEPASEKFQRRKSIEITCRYDERELPQHIQLRLSTYRKEISTLNGTMRERNATIGRLRHENRLNARVMRLKEEARIQGRAELLEEVVDAAELVRAKNAG